MQFNNLYNHGFARVCAVTSRIWAADPARNAEQIVQMAKKACQGGAALVVFPELCVSGYALDDLFHQVSLLDEVDAALETIATKTRDLGALLLVGAPLLYEGRVYNCCVGIQRGRILAATPKMYLASYGEFYEKRYFAEGARAGGDGIVQIADDLVPFGRVHYDCLDVIGFTVSPEVCEDVWVPLPPSTYDALSGATVIANLSGSPITVGRAKDRELMVASQSARAQVAYVYAAAGLGESSTDLAWDGQTMIYEAGTQLASGPRFSREDVLTFADVDLDRFAAARMRQSSYDDCRAATPMLDAFEPVLVEWTFGFDPQQTIPLERTLDRFPFVPDDPKQLDQDCFEAYNIQVSALVRRMESIGSPKIVIGVSGGLDSTHALIVAARAMDLVGRPRTDILAFTMPGFATSDHTKSNAYALGKALGVTFEELDIRPTALGMLKAMGHPAGDGEEVYDVTFENVQAGLRTDFLFRIANQRGGIVLGTGDMSELALGWCTYGVGDQMSHYVINSGLPKTMIQHVIRWVIAQDIFGADAAKVLDSILNTEISPELVPAKEGEEIQSTQAKIGPYELQDFNLYYLTKRGYLPAKVAFMSWNAWADRERGEFPAGYPDEERRQYDLQTILDWEELFIKRFFANQFKRSCVPNGPKVMGGGSLSPRGDWRMPSDASAQGWLADLQWVREAI
ncbi:NAD(+) synthase [Winkia sp. ACRQY]|uniref:NAD(+) synthase n=1 Tax=Winkia sp. ACRQY TaxID=2918182 RepID=UPI001EF2FB4E|nr:NAD(+) synthase [Winkia sp. ACRQY]MCG7303001.1 NAD(+) synthase [Winkia sp. ACRQY]